MPVKSSHLIQAEDLYRLQRLLDTRIAPDGRHVIMAVQRVDRATEQKPVNLWLAPTGRGSARQFTWGDQDDSSPRWSPDGKQIAFLSNRGAADRPAQLYLIPLEGGEARPLTTIPGSIDRFAWSPDGRQLVCTVVKQDAEAREREADEQNKKLGVVARHITRLFYKADGEGFLPQERTHLWLVNARRGTARQLTDHPVFDEWDPAWSPDSRWIVFASNRAETPDDFPDRIDLFRLPVAGGEPQRLETPLGPKGLAVYSPDGRWLAYLGHEGEGQWYRNLSLWLLPADGSGPARDLTEAHDICMGSFPLADTGGGDEVAPVWSPDGQHIYCQATIKGDSALMCIGNLQAERPSIDRVIGTPGLVGPFSFSRDHRRLAYGLARLTAPGQLHVQDMATGRTRSISRFNRWLGRKTLGEIEEVWFAAADGHPLQGWILFPPDFSPQRRYPSILEIHGGPHVQYDRGFMHEFHYLAAHGYIVYWSNPRGSQGYGEAHCQAIWGQWGTVDYDDIMAWADTVQRRPYIDPDRMGVTGGSYGGYLTNLIVGRSHRFQAAVTQRSVSNLVSMWGSSDGNWVFQESFGDGEPPFAAFDRYWAQSPLRTIGAARTPTLIMHSEMDLRANPEQSEQLYVALKRQGVPTEMVLFPEESHGLSRVGRTDRRIARLEHMRRWFDTYLQETPAA